MPHKYFQDKKLSQEKRYKSNYDNYIIRQFSFPT